MKNTLVIGLMLLASSDLSAADWLTAPSFYTHNPQTGQRVHQFARPGPFYYPSSHGARRRGYRHIRRSIQVGTSADHYHVIEEFGGPVRPYGEWRFPFRPYSVPYDAWGPPPPVFGVAPFGFGFAPGAGAGNAPPGNGGANRFRGRGRGYGVPPRGPWNNGNYRPSPPRRPRSR